MSETALDRVARALDLIPFILSNPGLSVIQIAQRFRSTPAQISKDLSLLHMCGLPGYGHLELLDIDYTDPNFISVTDAQVLDQPRSLTQLEAMTLLLGLRVLSELAVHEKEREAIFSLQRRIANLLGDQLTSKITITDAIEESPFIVDISRAIEAKQFLIIKYNSASSDSVTSREIYPLALIYRDGIAYLSAIAIAQHELRTFRVDRIVEITFGKIDTVYAEDFRGELASTLQNVEIEIGSDGLFFMEKHNEIVTTFSHLGDGYRISLRLSPGEWILRTLLSWPSRVVVLDPPELAALLRERITSTMANYE